MKILKVLAILVISLKSVHAQEPGYDETLAYIIENASYEAVFVSNSYGGIYTTQTVSQPKRCVLEIQDFDLSKPSDEPEFDGATRYNFSAMLPSSFSGKFHPSKQGQAAFFVIYFKINKKADYATSHWRGSYWEDTTAVTRNYKRLRIEIFGTDPQYYGSRLVKAFRHFSMLCGAKKELF